jgi:hypothetical protein
MGAGRRSYTSCVLVGLFLLGRALDAFSWFFIPPALGHGRKTEALLAATTLIIAALLILDPKSAYDSNATADLAWYYGYERWLFVPFLLKGVLSGSGVLLNIYGFRVSRVLRFCGAVTGVLIWTFLAAKLGLTGSMLFAFPLFLTFGVYASVGIMMMAVLNLPPVGAPAQWD